ncbi:MAG: HU family DNA-binding protein, partial [Rhodocyclaceae bacterium]|nr:HU family DNA-binding protein [Rhodocyclaceae bacterium]
NKREAKDMVEGVFGEVRTSLEGGEPVKLSGFGNFQLRDKPQRPTDAIRKPVKRVITARRVVRIPFQPKAEDRGGDHPRGSVQQF